VIDPRKCHLAPRDIDPPTCSRTYPEVLGQCLLTQAAPAPGTLRIESGLDGRDVRAIKIHCDQPNLRPPSSLRAVSPDVTTKGAAAFLEPLESSSTG
jgi:hypothetical protein